MIIDSTLKAPWLKGAITLMQYWSKTCQRLSHKIRDASSVYAAAESSRLQSDKPPVTLYSVVAGLNKGALSAYIQLQLTDFSRLYKNKPVSLKKQKNNPWVSLLILVFNQSKQSCHVLFHVRTPPPIHQKQSHHVNEWGTPQLAGYSPQLPPCLQLTPGTWDKQVNVLRLKC